MPEALFELPKRPSDRESFRSTPLGETLYLLLRQIGGQRPPTTLFLRLATLDNADAYSNETPCCYGGGKRVALSTVGGEGRGGAVKLPPTQQAQATA